MKINDRINHYEVYSILKDKKESVSGICRDKLLGHDWFIKFIPKDSKRNELETLLKLDHRRIPKVVDVVEEDAGTYFIMDYIRGMSLEEYFKLFKVTYSDLINMFIHLAMILEHVHCMSIIHGDIKIENLIMDEQSGLHLIDFGSAFSDNDSGSFSLDYVAPERLLSKYKADERSDIYSLGVLFLKMSRMIEYSFTKHYKLKRIILKCAKVNPSHRFTSVSDLKDALLKIR